MKTILYKAYERGSFDYGWLKTNYSFSFSSWHHPEKIHFGALRVLNDDTIAAGMGFGMHSHENMEIITIVTDGQLEHKDSMGNHGIIANGEVQVMSAGSGIQHSEFNYSKTLPVSLFQIWIFSNKKNIPPRYDQRFFDFATLKNNCCILVSPMGEKEGLNIQQHAWISYGKFEKNVAYKYDFKTKQSGVYLFIIEGGITLNSISLNRRDALGISDTEYFNLFTIDTTELLIIEIPL